MARPNFSQTNQKCHGGAVVSTFSPRQVPGLNLLIGSGLCVEYPPREVWLPPCSIVRQRPCSCNSLLTRPKPCIRRLFLSSFIKREFLWVRCAELWASLSVSHLVPSVSPSFPASSRCDSSCLIKTQQVPSSSPDTFYSPCFLFNM